MNAEAVVTVLSLGFGAWHLGRAALAQMRGWVPVRDDDADEWEPVAPPDYGAYAEEMDDDSPLTAEEWLRLLNDEADKIPHLFAYGPSGSGKSTLILALLKRRAGRLVICTPKNAADDPWGGFPAVRLGVTDDGEPDFGPLGDAIEAVYREMNRRNAGTSTDRTPITLVVDEITSIVYELKARDLTAKLIRLWLMGRSVRIRLITMDPTANVKGLGLEGRGDVRESIGWVRCERDKSAMLGELEECRAADGVPLDTAEVPRLAAGPLDPARVWAPTGSATREIRPGPPPGEFAPPTSAQVTPYEARLVLAWRDGGDTGMRSLARRLYEARGGQPPYDGSGGPYYAVRAALSGETLSA